MLNQSSFSISFSNHKNSIAMMTKWLYLLLIFTIIPFAAAQTTTTTPPDPSYIGMGGGTSGGTNGDGSGGTGSGTGGKASTAMMNGSQEHVQDFLVEHGATISPAILPAETIVFGENYLVQASVTHGNGSTTFAGTFQGSLNLAGKDFKSEGAEDWFVAKVNPMGELEWSHQIGSVDTDWIHAMTPGNNGEVIITGHFNETIAFNDALIHSRGHADIFSVGFDSEGNVTWSNRFGGNSDDRLSEVYIKEGKLILEGNLRQTFEVEGLVKIDQVFSRPFAAQYSMNGNLNWIDFGEE